MIDFTPQPVSASLPAMITAQARMEMRLLTRQGEQLIVTMVIPIIALIVGANITDINTAAPGALALAIMSSSFTSMAVSTGFERRYGLLRRMATTPLPRSALLLGKLTAVAGVQIIQLTVIAVIALLLGWQPESSGAAAAWLVALALLGTAAFGSLALLLAGTLRAEATLGVANLVYVVLMVGGAIIVPLDSYPPSAQKVLAFLPSSALGESLRALFSGGLPGTFSLVVLAVWAILAGFVTSRTFKWE